MSKSIKNSLESLHPFSGKFFSDEKFPNKNLINLSFIDYLANIVTKLYLLVINRGIYMLKRLALNKRMFCH